MVSRSRAWVSNPSRNSRGGHSSSGASERDRCSRAAYARGAEPTQVIAVRLTTDRAIRGMSGAFV